MTHYGEQKIFLLVRLDITANCLVGKNTTADWCAISGSKYRLKIANENLFNDITITGALVLTN